MNFIGLWFLIQIKFNFYTIVIHCNTGGNSFYRNECFKDIDI